jgi:molybdenum cofactor biosynthesis enzyme MoaA
MAKQYNCCESPKHSSAPIDCVISDKGLRLRHITGEICLNCRNIWIPHVSPSLELQEAVLRCINLDPVDIIILKAIPVININRIIETTTYAEFEPVLLDIGIGKNSGLVIEKLKGYWNWETCEAILPNEGEELRERLTSFHNDMEGILVPSLLYDTPSHPNSLQIEITTRCNLTCAYCSHKDLSIKSNINMEKFRSILDKIDFSYIENIDLTGLGEPVMHPELPEIIKEIRLRGNPKHIRIVTNGTALSASRFIPLCEAGITSIAFSIDSMDPKHFARSRGGAKLEKVLENLEALVNYRKSHHLQDLSIKIKAVLVDNPYDEAEALLSESARLGLEMPHFSCLDTRNSAQQVYKDDWLKDNWSNSGSMEFTLWAETRWQELTIKYKTDHPSFQSGKEKIKMFMNPILSPPPDQCRWSIDAAFISVTGDLLACCEQMIDLPRNYQGH